MPASVWKQTNQRSVLLLFLCICHLCAQSSRECQSPWNWSQAVLSCTWWVNTANQTPVPRESSKCSQPRQHPCVILKRAIVHERESLGQISNQNRKLDPPSSAKLGGWAESGCSPGLGDLFPWRCAFPDTPSVLVWLSSEKGPFSFNIFPPRACIIPVLFWWSPLGKTDGARQVSTLTFPHYSQECGWQFLVCGGFARTLSSPGDGWGSPRTLPPEMRERCPHPSVSP